MQSIPPTTADKQTQAPVLIEGKSIKGPGVGLGTLPGLQGAGHGLQMRVAVCLHMQTKGLLLNS